MAGPIPLGAIIERPGESLFEQYKRELLRALPELAEEMEWDRLWAMISNLMYSDNPEDRFRASQLYSMAMRRMQEMNRRVGGAEERQIITPSRPGVQTW